MKLLTAMLTLLFAVNSFAGWKSDTKKVLKEFNSDVSSTKTAEQYNDIYKAYTKIKKYYEEKTLL